MKQLIPKDNYDEYKRRQWKEVDRLYELKLFSNAFGNYVNNS